MKKILFYGASVTHQKAPSGFYDLLAEVLSLDAELFRLTYPSSQFSNAGFFNVKKIIDIKPDFVFFEWSSTGESVYDDMRFKSVIKKLNINAINFCFLILPTAHNIKNRQSEDQIYFYSKICGFQILDLRFLVSVHLISDLLRDGVHTNELGAKVFASEIFKFIQDLNPSKSYVDFDVPNFQIEIIEEPFILNKNGTLLLNFDGVDEYSEISSLQILGPSSPIIDYYSEGHIIFEKCFFDPWCYYERENFISLVPNSIFESNKRSLELRISNKKPDYKLISRQNFDPPEDRSLNVMQIYTCNLTNLRISMVDHCV